MGEPLGAAFLVLAEATVAWALASAALRSRAAGSGAALLASVAAGAAIGVATGLLAAARGVPVADVAVRLGPARQLFALALLGGALALRVPPAAAPRTRLLRGAAEAGLLAAGLLWPIAEAVGLGLLLHEAAVLAGRWRGVAVGAVLGGAAAAAAGLAVRRLADAARLSRLAPGTLLALLFALKLAGPGAAGAALPSLARALTAMASRAIHDALHVTFVLLQLPDHPYLRDAAYQLVLSFLAPLPHAIVAAAALSAPVLVAWRAFARRRPPAPAPSARAPERRLVRSAFRAENRLAAGAFAAGLAAVAIVILASQAKSDDLREPIPEPVVEDGQGAVVVPLGGPFSTDDGGMRKYVWSSGGHAVTFFTMRRLDGSLAVALDLCEMCLPKGYAQLGKGYVFCKHCSTPIPVDTVGQPGGCNPIPLPTARVEGAVLRIPAADLRALYDRAMADKR
jgi:hypothetical protein